MTLYCSLGHNCQKARNMHEASVFPLFVFYTLFLMLDNCIHVTPFNLPVPRVSIKRRRPFLSLTCCPPAQGLDAIMPYLLSFWIPWTWKTSVRAEPSSRSPFDVNVSKLISSSRENADKDFELLDCLKATLKLKKKHLNYTLGNRFLRFLISECIFFSIFV